MEQGRNYRAASNYRTHYSNMTWHTVMHKCHFLFECPYLHLETCLHVLLLCIDLLKINLQTWVLKKTLTFKGKVLFRHDNSQNQPKIIAIEHFRILAFKNDQLLQILTLSKIFETTKNDYMQVAHSFLLKWTLKSNINNNTPDEILN